MKHVKWLHSRVGSCFTNKHYNRLEKLTIDKHCSLLRQFENYGCNFFITSTPGANVIKNFGPRFTDFRTKIDCLLD